MGNTIEEDEILVYYEWSCPSCQNLNSGSDVYDPEPIIGNVLYCSECGKPCEITK